MSDSIESLEQHKAYLKQAYDTFKALERLQNNRDFKKIILEGFLVQDCARSVAVSVDPGLSQDIRESAMGMAKAAGYLKQYLQALYAQLSRAGGELKEVDEALIEARAEEQ